ncbi:MAG TPA: DASS family sodium-coupled anion symporter [bacterium]
MEPIEVISPAEERFERIRKTLGLFVGPLVFAAFFFIHLPGLSPSANRLAAVLFLVIIWWITEPIPIPVTALIGACLAVITGVEAAKQAFAPFADPVVFLFIGSFILAEAMSLHKLDRRIAFALLSVKAIGTSTSKILFTFGLIAVCISMWISNTATTAMLLPISIGIINSLCHVVSERSKKNISAKSLKYSTALMLMAAYGASIGGIGTPVGTPPNLIGIGMINRLLNIRISFFQWMVLAVPLVIIMYFVLFVLLNVMYRSKTRSIAGIDEYIKEKKAAIGPMTTGERNVLIAFSITVVMWVLPGFFALIAGSGSNISKWYESHIPEGVAAIIGAALLFVLPVDWRKRRFTMNWQDAVKIDWGTILLFGGGLALGTLMFTTGLAEALGKWILSITHAGNATSITAISIGLGILVSEITSNTASANMVIPVMISLAQTAGINPLGPALGACIGASYGFMLPVSTPPNAIVYGSGMVPITRMVRTGIFFDIIGFFIILLAILFYLPILNIH